MNHNDHEPSDERAAGRLSSALRRAMQSAIAEGMADPRVEGCLITVLDAVMTPDRSTVRFHISVLPGERGMLALAALRHASGRLKAGMFKKIEIRRLPRLEFVLDDSLKKQAALDAAMQAASQSRGHIPASDCVPEEPTQD